jgi:hypothetical protein
MTHDKLTESIAIEKAYILDLEAEITTLQRKVTFGMTNKAIQALETDIKTKRKEIQKTYASIKRYERQLKTGRV